MIDEVQAVLGILSRATRRDLRELGLSERRVEDEKRGPDEDVRDNAQKRRTRDALRDFRCYPTQVAK